jgi:hypothetical protein
MISLLRQHAPTGVYEREPANSIWALMHYDSKVAELPSRLALKGTSVFRLGWKAGQKLEMVQGAWKTISNLRKE